MLANLPDGRVIAINRDNGEIIWDKKIAAKNEFGGQERFSAAPLVADGKVLVQNGAGDAGTRGWVAALDVNTGNELWRWYTVPKPGDPGSETWKDDHNAWKTGGGGIWQTGSYDPAQNLYIFGTGNPYPIYDPQFRPGDNLYTNSVVALNVATGKMAWHFQYTPSDSWDYDEAGVFMLYDTTINGRAREGGRPLRPQRVLLHRGPDQRTVHRRREVRQRSQLDQGHRSGNRQAAWSTTRSSTCRSTTPRRARFAATRRSARARPGTAASRISRWPTTRSRTSPTASAPKAASRRTAPRSACCRRTAASTPRRASRGSTAAISTTAR